MEQITVTKLFDLCNEQIKKGNGDKMIVVSADPEGNEFNGLFGGFARINANMFELLGDTKCRRDLKDARDNLIALGVW